MMPRGGATSMLRCCWRAAFCVRNPYSPIWSQSRRRKMARIQRQKNAAKSDSRRRPSGFALVVGIEAAEAVQLPFTFVIPNEVRNPYRRSQFQLLRRSLDVSRRLQGFLTAEIVRFGMTI